MRFPLRITHNLLLEPVMNGFGVKPENSFVELSGGTLEVCMGHWFHEKLAVADIAQFGPAEWPWWAGVGVKLHHQGIGVVGSSEDVVNIRLKEPRPMRAVVLVDAEQLWISLVEPAQFLQSLVKATGLAIAPPVKG